jgi:hypothetical protein
MVYKTGADEDTSPSPIRANIHEIIHDLQASVKALSLKVEERDLQITSLLDIMNSRVNDLSTLVYGNSNIRVRGLTDRVEDMESLVDRMNDERREQAATMKGIKIGLALTAVTGAGTLISIITEILQR